MEALTRFVHVVTRIFGESKIKDGGTIVPEDF